MRLRRTELFGATAIFGGALIVSACSGGEDYPSYDTMGGSSNASTGGVASNTGGTTGGVAPSTGGTLSTGGVQGTGGTTGGIATGGFSTGGTAMNTGGTKSGTGGFGGKSGTGGKSGGTGGSGGKAGGTGGSGGKSGGTGGSGGGATVAFSQVVTFVKSTCEPCHNATMSPNLSTTNATALYTTLTTVTVSQCGGNKLVTANDTSKSALLMMGTGKCSGFRMPSGCTTNSCYAANDVTMLTNWIQSGAKNP